MSTAEEVDAFYSEHYYKLINYIRNGKKGGDAKSVITDEAIDILHDCYCYHKAHPTNFHPRYIWNVLKQRRMNYLRDVHTYNSVKDDFFHNFYRVQETKESNGLEDILSKQQMKGIIVQELRAIHNRRHKTLLKEVILDGKTSLSSGERSVIERFKNRIVDKYGDDDG